MNPSTHGRFAARLGASWLLFASVALSAGCGGDSTGPSPSLEITTAALRNAVLNELFLQQIEAKGGRQPYQYSLVLGSLLPGFTLDASTGVIRGTATTEESRIFRVEVRSADDQTAQASYRLGAYGRLQVTTASLDTATQAFAYDDTLTASGGDGTNSWSIVSGSLPGNMQLDAATGRISGTPSVLQTSALTVQVASGDGQIAQAPLALTVAAYVLTPTESCSDHVPESIVTFEDDNLAVAVRMALQVPVGTGLTCERADDLLTLNAQNAGISSIAGTQNMPALEYVYLSSNSISDLAPLQGLTGLKYLIMDQNGVTDLTALSGLTALTHLALGGNAVTDLAPLSGLDSLTHLTLNTNSITDVDPLSGLGSLELLWLGENPIGDVTPLAGLSSLTNLSLYDSDITDISSLAGLSGLTRLALGRDTINDLSPIAALSNLETLTLEVMGITDIGFASGLTSLSVLGLSYNQITDVGPLSGLTQLVQLGLYSNAVSDVSGLGGLTNLSELFLGINAISDITALGALTTLTRLHLRQNTLTDISALEGLTQLYEIVLDGNVGLSNIQPLLDNTGMGPGDQVWLNDTSVPCTDVNALAALGVSVYAACT